MRNLHAELENWNCDEPFEWNPRPGDILVGVVKDYSATGQRRDDVETVTVREEEAGATVVISLDAPELANLFRLQRPRVGERIGLKYEKNGPGGGEKRFVLVVDRLTDGEGPDERPDDGDQDDACGATPEERLFIEEALDAAPEPSIPCAPTSTAHESALREIIRRQDQEIDRQAESVRKLEDLLAAAISPAPRSSGARAVLDDAPAPDPKTRKRRGGFRTWCGRIILTLLIVAASYGMGITAARLALRIH